MGRVVSEMFTQAIKILSTSFTNIICPSSKRQLLENLINLRSNSYGFTYTHRKYIVASLCCFLILSV